LGLPVGWYADSLTNVKVGWLHIKAYTNSFEQAGYHDFFADTSGKTRGKRSFASVLVEELEAGSKYRIWGDEAERIIDLDHLSLKNKDYAEIGKANLIEAGRRSVYRPTSLQRFLKGNVGEAISSGLIDFALAVPETVAMLQNPYLTPGQKWTQGLTTGFNSGASAVLGTWAAGSLTGLPAFAVGVAVGVAVYGVFEYGVKPGISWFAVNITGKRDPFQEYYNFTLSP